MQTYKRNQVEEAIARVLHPEAQARSSEVRTRLKRLLNLDRRLAGGVRRKQSANYAFYSAEAPGKGVEVQFSAYEAFALLNGVRMLELGFPQGVAVTILRLARRELEQEYPALAAAKPMVTRDPDGDAAGPYLVVAPMEPKTSKISKPSYTYKIGPWREVTIFGRERGSWSCFPLAEPARDLATELARAEPRRRGPGVEK